MKEMFRKFRRFFSGEDKDEQGFDIDNEGKVTYHKEKKSVKELKSFGACVFIGVVNGECIFEPAEIVVPKWRFNQISINRIDEDGNIIKDVPNIDRVDVNEPLTEPDTLLNDESNDKACTEGEIKAETSAEPFMDNPGNLSAAALPCFLTDKDAESDLGHFINYFQTVINAETGTVNNYAKEIKLWRKDLKEELTSERIAEILRMLKNNPSRVNNRLTALRAYADYRHEFGDSRLKIILGLSRMIKRLHIQTERKVISFEMMLTSYKLAEVFASQGDRAGIWIGLILFGFRTTEFASLNHEKTENDESVYYVYRGRKGKRNKIYRTGVPDWLYYAYEKADKKDVKRSAVTIGAEIRKYGINIQQLYNACNYYDNFDWRKYSSR